MVVDNSSNNANKGDMGDEVFEYNVNGIPFSNLVSVNDLGFIGGNVVRDMNRAIILKPITREKVVEVMAEEIEEKVVYVPQVRVVDKYVEVVKPVIRYKIKEVKRPVTVERIKRVPKIVEEEKIVEVPEIQYVEKHVEVPKIVQKEKIIEVPLPMVRERRIPVLNILKREMSQEIDSVRYPLNHSDTESSIITDSSLTQSLCQFQDEIQGENLRDNELDCKILGEICGDDLQSYNSKLVNYNTNEHNELSESDELDTQLNQVEFSEFDQCNEVEEADEVSEVAIEDKSGECEDFEEFEEGAGEIGGKGGIFESRMLTDGEFQEEISRKIITNLSSQIIPKSLKLLKQKKTKGGLKREIIIEK